MYPNASGPHAARTSGEHQRPTHPAYAQPRATGPHQASGPHRVTGPQQAVPHRGTGPHQAPPRPPAPPAKQAGPKLVAAAVALAVLGGVGGWLAYDAPAENQYQTVSYAGDNPFTSPVGTDRPDVTPVAAGGERPGETPEMYTEDPAKPACDAASLVEQLQADPAKAAAWADVQRITPAALPRFVDGLKPVVLRANTALVDHSYVDRTFQATPAVLAPGTAVFVNAYGQPTVKCFSGNPLTPGTTDDPAVTTVRPAAVAITSVTVRNVVTGGPITRPGPVDTTGTGPSTGGDDGGGDKGEGGGTTAPAITAAYNTNGSISLSDGRLRLASGEILPAIPLPEGAKRNPDGGWTTEDGKVFNRNGGERLPIRLGENILTPQGTWTDLNGKEVPLKPGEFLVSNPDGTWSNIFNNPDGTFSVLTFGPEDACENCGFGTRSFPGQFDPKINGVRVPPDGKIQNIDRTPREEKVEIPGVGTVGGDNTNTPAKRTFRTEDKPGEALVNGDKNVEPAKKGTENTTIDPKTGKEIDPATGKEIDPATGKPVEEAPADKKAPKAGTNTGVDPVDPVVVEPVPAKKVPGNTGVIVPPVEEPTGSTTGTSAGTSAGTSTGTSSGTADTSSGTTSGSGESTSTGSGEGGNG